MYNYIFKLNDMHHESSGHEAGSFSKKIKKPKMDDFSDLAKGTDPGLKEDFSEDEVTGEYKKDSSSDKDVAGIMEGLDKAGVMIAAEKAAERKVKPFSKAAVEERKAGLEAKRLVALKAEEEQEWAGKISVAKQKIAAEGESPKVADKGKSANLETKQKIDQKLAAEEEARWEDKEWVASRKIAAEAQENKKWENAEWQAKTKVAEDKEEVRSILTRLKERLGFGKKKEKR